MKLIRRISYVLLIFVFSVKLLAAEKNESRAPQGLSSRVWAQEIIFDEAHRLAEEGFYDQAIEKFRESLDPRFIESEMDKAGFFNGALRVHRLQGKFREALGNLQWFMKINPKGDGWMDDKLQLEALVKAWETKSNQPVNDYIKYLRGKYKGMLPPDKCDGNYGPIVVSKIIFCYGWIGDSDGGISFMDEFLQYWEKKSGQDLHRPGNRNQYFLIREAFEQDKAEGFKGCLDAKPGDACMGRATKALIKSDYFPW